ncbi:hypothetical protein BDQ12DRAFT_601197 [Crucibulum laeve]|uniref:T6SS Phospholipase effector Tle1-like catalytic domain-containing protein n=1 Tax=Crucibulum laeve TaxID=68775 RepID=A0A5C3M9V5_9AGAR|nr:hypothetical protein BDQ12DRAFT_601197 [Crucibulum laeve]
MQGSPTTTPVDSSEGKRHATTLPTTSIAEESVKKAASTTPVPTTTEPPAVPERRRTLILCFDGTGNKFGENSNVVRFFQALKKDNAEEQLGYYQAGIGTYTKRQFITKTATWISTKLDEAFALHLNDHVKEGYQFLMQNYRKGDKVCMFGFSRGAYTARALAGMIYKVGLLPPHNDQQLDFAFTVYNSTDKHSSKLAYKFKKTFAFPIAIDFLGVWDTVSSVGIIPRSLPYSSFNDGVRVFRHALALDELRARFRPNIWGEPIATPEMLHEEPQIKLRDKNTSRDEWVYEPPEPTDVKEVWFTGCHADVGGGSHTDDVDASLSNIPLRWMIKECFLAKMDILFDNDLLYDMGLDLSALNKDPSKVSSTQHYGHAAQDSLISPPSLHKAVARIVNDVVADIYNQLFLVPHWWLLEIIPMLSTRQAEDGNGWWRLRIRNFGRGRYLPYSSDGLVRIHPSVKRRIDKTHGTPYAYLPSAYNWDVVKQSGRLNWEEDPTMPSES